jgi:hypothetical protein
VYFSGRLAIAAIFLMQVTYVIVCAMARPQLQLKARANLGKLGTF